MQVDQNKYSLVYYFYFITVYDRTRIWCLYRSSSDAFGGFTTAYEVRCTRVRLVPKFLGRAVLVNRNHSSHTRSHTIVHIISMLKT